MLGLRKKQRMQSQKFTSGDEVCRSKNGEVVFGTLVKPLSEGKWSVRWLYDPKHFVPSDVDESDIILTDRTLYKGRKVRSVNDRNKVGICRSMVFNADLRVIGTNSIIPNVNIDEFANLKEYKQKSVVYYKGWLGVITAVQREALVHKGGTQKFESLETLIPSGVLAVEQPFIYEQLSVPHFTAPIELGTDPDLDEMEKKRSKRLVFIKDLRIVSVKVHWSHQVDINCPDKPRQEFKKYEDLKLVKEELSSDKSFLHIGNLGRYKIQSGTEFVRWDCWQKNFVRKEKLDFNLEFKALEDNWRAYDLKLYESEEVDPQEKMRVGEKVVVEIAHLQGTACVQWAGDPSVEYLSSRELQVVEGSLLDNLALIPGDFLTLCPKIKLKYNNFYAVLVQIQDQGKQVVLRIVDSENPGSILEDHRVCEIEACVRHPIYRNFNESDTIVVIYEHSKIRVGHCIGTNLLGKVNIRFYDTNKEEWVWPQGCAIYSVKGYDLECVQSQITDSDSQETRFRRAQETLKRIDNVWRNISTSDANRKDALHELKVFVDTFLALSSTNNFTVDLSRYAQATNLLPTRTDLRGDQELIILIQKCIQDLTSQSQAFLTQLVPETNGNGGGDLNVEEEEAMEIDQEVDVLTKMFSKPVVLMDEHPKNHHFAQTTKFEPASHQKFFIKVVRDELDTLQKNTNNGSSSSIITKAFSDRMDLLSILIRGPEGTPYENSVYLFDAVLPPNYPAIPPKFHFHSFSAGRLNPNLYAEGKVCVSLLGTWAGKDPREKWTKESNIFQVIISIQGLILVSEPYHNEPGQEAEIYKPSEARIHCHRYNQQLMPIVIKMMTNQITMPHPPWEEEIKNYYKKEAPVFIARWKKWLAAKNETDLPLKERPGFAIYPMLPPFIAQIKALLTTLEVEVAKIN